MSRLIVTFNIQDRGISDAIQKAIEKGNYKAVAECVDLCEADKMEVIDE